jgi:hypothetical protein
MFAQRDEAHNAANRCSRGRLADTAVRVRVRWLRGVLGVVRVFIGSGVPVHVSCAHRFTGHRQVSFDAAQRTSDATAAAIARALAGTGTPSTRVVGVPLTPRASARWVT